MKHFVSFHEINSIPKQKEKIIIIINKEEIFSISFIIIINLATSSFFDKLAF